MSQDLAVGGFASFDGIGGTGRLIVEVPGEVIVGDLTKFFAAGEGQVMAGARLSTDRLHLIGGSLQNDGIIDVGGTGLTAADGELLVSPTGELVVDGGSHELGALRLEPGSTFDFRSGALSFAGGTMQFPDTSYVYGSASGLPTFEFTDGALAEVTFVWRVGGLVDTAGLTRLQIPGRGWQTLAVAGALTFPSATPGADSWRFSMAPKLISMTTSSSAGWQGRWGV